MSYGGIFGGLFGQQTMASNPSQLQNAQQNMYANSQATQTLQHAYTQAQLSHLGRWRDTAPEWMWNGQIVTLEAFATLAYGDDTPEKTMFILKYTKESK